MSDLRSRTQEINAEYWSAREDQTERVAIAQLTLALARLEAALAARDEENHALRARLRLASREAHAENVLAGGAHRGEWDRCPHSDCVADRAALAVSRPAHRGEAHGG